MRPVGAGQLAAVLAALGACATQPSASLPPDSAATAAATPTPVPAAAAPAPPVPADSVPDQPYRGPSTATRPYRDIIAMKEAGASEEALLEKIRKENLRYALTTSEILQLQAAGVTDRVIEAMLRSGTPKN